MRYFSFLMLCTLMFLACTRPADNATSKSTENFPKLLQRAEPLTLGKEWDDTQNIYAATLEALRKDPNDYHNRLKLAELFVREARVTGEHPHYYPAALRQTDYVVQQLRAADADANKQAGDQLFRALSLQASIELSQHNFAKALQTAEEAVMLNPHNAFIYGCLVDAHVELGHYAQAVEACDKMVSIRPDLRSYARVSYLREIHDDLKGAVAAMEMAVEAGMPGYEETEWARLQLGKLYEKAGQMDKAALQYQQSLAFRPNYPFATAALGEWEAAKGNYVDAEVQLKKSIEAIPEIGFYLELARIYQKTNRDAELAALLPKIQTMFEEDSQSGHRVGLELARFHVDFTKNISAAELALQEEIAMRPTNRDVQQVQQLIVQAKTHL